MTRVELSEVSVIRTGRDGQPRAALSSASLELTAGSRSALVGPNGAGKTSLLLALVAALPHQGRIQIGEHRLEPSTVAAVRRDVGFVFADPTEQLFMPSVWEEVAFGPRERGLSSADVQARTEQALADVELGGFEARRPDELSLGEQRRLLLATVLAIRPQLILLDEPTANLDARARRMVLDVLGRVEATLLFATHDLDAALALDAGAILLHEGRVVARGRGRELLEDPLLLARAGLEPRACQRPLCPSRRSGTRN